MCRRRHQGTHEDTVIAMRDAIAAHAHPVCVGWGDKHFVRKWLISEFLLRLQTAIKPRINLALDAGYEITCPRGVFVDVFLDPDDDSCTITHNVADGNCVVIY